MISDTLFDAIAEIDRYLTDPVFAGAYAEADVRAHVQRVREEMESLRVRLDEVAPASEPPSPAPVATKVRDLECKPRSARVGGILSTPAQALYRCEGGPLPPFVVVSAVTVLGEPETYIFHATELGQIVDYAALDGSLKGTLDHATALRDAGYEVRQ